MSIPTNNHSLSEFQQQAPALLDKLKTDKTPIVLTVDGKAKAVVQDADSYQQLLDKIDLLESLAGIRTSIKEFGQGQGVPLKQAFEQLQQKHDIPN